MKRRSLFGMLFGLAGAAFAQKGITLNGQAIVCKEDSVACPVCKKQTCKILNAPIMVGNDNREYPDQAQMYDFKILCCQSCRAAFFA